jgi:HEAT repeat protein
MHERTGDARCAPALLVLAGSDREEAWRPALAGLRRMGDAETSRVLVERLEADGAPDTERTHMALAAVGGIGSEQAIPFLVSQFSHESPAVARSAADAVTDIGDASVDALMDELSNIDRQNRMMAALALSRLGDRHGHEAARRFLNTARNGEEETIDEIRRNLLKH